MTVAKDHSTFNSSGRPRIYFILLVFFAFTVAMVLLYFSTHKSPVIEPGYFRPRDFGLEDVPAEQPPLLCLQDCQKLQSMLSAWPKTNKKPKAAIYYLIHPRNLYYLIKSLKKLNKFFTRNFSYPIIIFHESDWNVTLTEKVRSSTDDEIFFQEVHFETPVYYSRPVPSNVGPLIQPYGYRHMCRFHAKTVYEQPIIQGFEYLFRLDDDSFIDSPVNYDIFLHMRKNNFIYGYHDIKVDGATYVRGLWEASNEFIRSRSIKPKYFNDWQYRCVYFTNFEISRTDFWLSKEYQDFINYIDQLGGMYFHRWGDAPIKTIGVAIFVPPKQVHHYSDIQYSHGRPKKT